MCVVLVFFFFKQKTAYEMRISDWSSDVCSSDLPEGPRAGALLRVLRGRRARPDVAEDASAADRGRVPHRPGGVRRGLLRGDDRRRGDEEDAVQIGRAHV